MEKTLGERSKEEDRRVMEEGLRSVSSNYLFCPSLCRTCNNFSESNSTFPYKCNTGHSDHIAYKSEKEGYKQYDECRYFKEKEEDHHSSNVRQATNSAIDNIVATRRREQEKKEKKREEEQQQHEKRDQERRQEKEEAIRQEEYNETHCHYCGEQGILVPVYDNYFHEPCWDKFKETENGKKWIDEQEQKKKFLERCEQIRAIVKKYDNIFSDPVKEFTIFAHTATNYKNKLEAFLNADINQFVSYVETSYNKEKIKNEQKRKRQIIEEKTCLEHEEKERAEAENLKKEQEKKARETKEKRRLQYSAKLPIFLIVSLVSVFGNDFSVINTWLPISVIAGILFLFYKILGGMFNAVYDTLNKENEKGKTFSKFFRFITYAIGCIIIISLHCGIVFLVMHILLKIW